MAQEVGVGTRGLRAWLREWAARGVAGREVDGRWVTEREAWLQVLGGVAWFGLGLGGGVVFWGLVGRWMGVW